MAAPIMEAGAKKPSAHGWKRVIVFQVCIQKSFSLDLLVKRLLNAIQSGRISMRTVQE